MVCTKLAKELSYIFYELKDIFQEYIDEKNVLIETINEAKRIAEEIINIA